jgi:hypothetical protein
MEPHLEVTGIPSTSVGNTIDIYPLESISSALTISKDEISCFSFSKRILLME